MTNQTRHDKRSSSQRHWQAHVKAQMQSGLNRTEYSRQYKLSYHAMTYWHNKLSRSINKKSTLVPVPLHNIEQPAEQSQNSSLIIILPDNISVEVGDNFSSAALTRLLTTLKSR